MYDGESTVFLQDWYHQDGYTRRTGLDTSPFIWIGNANSFLINGGGIFTPCLGDDTEGLSCDDDCSIDNYIKTIEVEAGKTYRLRIIAGTELIGVNFAIHGHNMTVVSKEFCLCFLFINLMHINIHSFFPYRLKLKGQLLNHLSYQTWISCQHSGTLSLSRLIKSQAIIGVPQL